MSDAPLVSVVIPTYNRVDFLLQAVESVQRQSLRNWELTVVDDGSTDSTARRLEELADPRVRLIRQDRQGVSKARNTGLARSRGTWLSLLDSDDLWAPRKLQRQLEALERQPAYLLCHTDEIWIRDGVRVNQKKIHRKRGGWIFEDCLPRCVVSPSSILLHRKVLERHGTFDEDLPVCEDYELWLRLSCRLPFLYLGEPLVIKRGGHGDQLSRSRRAIDRFRVQALLKTWRTCPLTPRLRLLAASQIARKSSILAVGCEKWNRPEEARLYRQLAQEWNQRTVQLRGPLPEPVPMMPTRSWEP